jgi:porin
MDSWYQLRGMIAVVIISLAGPAASEAQVAFSTCDSGPSACDSCSSYDACNNDSFFPSLSSFRADLAEKGINYQGNFTQFYFGNNAGGLEREYRFGGHHDNLFNFDFGKLGIQEGLFLKIRAERRTGESLADATGAFLPPALATDLPVADRRDLYVTNFVFTQALSESFVLFAGKVDALDGDQNAFASGRGITQFSNSAFVANPIALRTVPYSTLGAGMAFLFEGEPILNFLVLNATDTVRTSGFDELFAEGVTLNSELRLPTNFFDMPGHQLIGGTWSSREIVALGQDPRIVLPNVPIQRQSGSWSLYWNCDQTLVGDAERGWGFFARAGIGDDSTNPLAYFLSAGLGGSSMMSGRDNDTFGVGYFYSATSNEIGPLLNATLGQLGDGQGVELFYNAAVNRHLSITPDFQVLMPARDSVDTALVAGIRANLIF